MTEEDRAAAGTERMRGERSAGRGATREDGAASRETRRGRGVGVGTGIDRYEINSLYQV